MKIVVLDGYALNPGDLSWDGFRKLGELDVYDRTFMEDRYDRSKDADVIITNKTLIDKELILQLPNLKYIGVLATGYNVVDVKEAAERNIPVTNVPAYGSDSVAQMIFALILELTNHVSGHSEAVRNGSWSLAKDFCFWNKPIMELRGKNLGIIGFGNIGKRVADIASAFGMNVLLYSRTINDESKKYVKWVTLEEIFTNSDIISLNCPLTDETKGIINSHSLSKMKQTAYLINASRGPLIIEKDLADALNRGTIAGAGLDVLSMEPPLIDNPLLKANNCFITPHIAWASREARERLMDIAVENLRAFINGNEKNVVN